jgi:hypothetical protein
VSAAFHVPAIHARIVTFNLERRLGGHGLKDEVVIAVWAVFVTKER